ncbi:hypothetical protein D9M71_433850 [compost metagenome]
MDALKKRAVQPLQVFLRITISITVDLLMAAGACKDQVISFIGQCFSLRNTMRTFSAWPLGTSWQNVRNFAPVHFRANAEVLRQVRPTKLTMPSSTNPNNISDLG